MADVFRKFAGFTPKDELGEPEPSCFQWRYQGVVLVAVDVRQALPRPVVPWTRGNNFEEFSEAVQVFAVSTLPPFFPFLTVPRLCVLPLGQYPCMAYRENTSANPMTSGQACINNDVECFFVLSWQASRLRLDVVRNYDGMWFRAVVGAGCTSAWERWLETEPEGSSSAGKHRLAQ